MKMAYRIQHNRKLNDPAYKGVTKKTKVGAVWTGLVHLSERAILKPLSWRKNKIIFVNSMSDTFHDAVRFEDVARIWAVMALTPQHTYQLLTKRPDRMVAWLNNPDTIAAIEHEMQEIRLGSHIDIWPLMNVWVGTSVEDQQRANERIPIIAQAPAITRFLSVEPLLGPVSMADAVQDDPRLLRKINWVIVGGESGPKARPMHPAWARSLRSECRKSEIPFFFKQVGSWSWRSPQTRAQKAMGLMKDGKVVEFGKKGSQPIVFGSKKSGGRLLDGNLYEDMPPIFQMPHTRENAA
jgi:protein gp37